MAILVLGHRDLYMVFLKIFLQFIHQVDMKNVVKCWKDFLSYFTTLETYRAYLIFEKA